VAVTLDRAGSVNIDLGGRVPKSGSSMTEFFGGTGSGILRVDDTYTDTNGGAATTGEQTADGPGVRDGFNNLASLVLRPSTCPYVLDILFGVKTASTGDWPPSPDERAGGVAITPRRHLPSNLKLFGTAGERCPRRRCCADSGIVMSPEGLRCRSLFVARRAGGQRDDRDHGSNEGCGGGDAQSEIHAADEP